MQAANAYLESLLGEYAAPAMLGWSADLRRRALERAHQLTVPTTRDEAWRFTDLSPLYKLAFKPAAINRSKLNGSKLNELPGARLAAFNIAEATMRLVFIDGQYAPAHSLITDESGLTVESLASALQTREPLLRRLIDTIAPHDTQSFRAINTAYLHDGALIHVARNAAPAAPVHVLFVNTQAEVASHPRVLVVAEDGAEITFIEDYVGLADGPYFVNAVTEIAVGANAHVRHTRVQRESAQAFHVATNAARVDRDGRYESVSVAFGARISRLDLQVTQAGVGASIDLAGLALIGDRQLADTHSFVDHAQPNGSSRQLHKCIAGGNAHGVFNGKIRVARGAQRTDSAQQTRTLLLSNRAYVDVKPELEIFADDVKAAHGATIGQLDAEELFYLQSRGIDPSAARNLLTYGFAAEVIDRIPVRSLAMVLKRAVLAQTHA